MTTKHVRLAILIVRAFLMQKLEQQSARSLLGLIERIVDNTWSDPQRESFCTMRWGQICERLRKRRSQYRQLMKRNR